jgi:hypothetical protein
MGGSAAPSEAVQPGAPVSLSIPADATGLAVTKPDGSVIELVPQSAGSRSVSFTGTDLPGIYVVTPHLVDGAIASPAASASGAGASALASPTAVPSGSASPGASGSATPSRAPVDPNAPVRFAVDLFDVDESTISPGSAATIEALGHAPAASPGATGAPAGGGNAATQRPTARDELWIPIVLIVLVALCVEWAVYQRDAIIRLRRGLAARFGRQPGDAGA